ncbi:MAG: hypothetical protein N3F03_02375 [Ignavibacteria bacterium]|nr:hypothetical protein [Ignavibacteria bacterium]
MSDTYSIQFKLGIAGIISSLIWIAVKFGLFTLTEHEWISLSGVIFSLVIFIHFYGSEKINLVLISSILFFFSVTFFLYFYQTRDFVNRSNFDFNYLIYGVGFALGSVLLSLVFNEKVNSRFKVFLTSIVLLFGAIIYLLVEFQLPNLRNQFQFLLSFSEYINWTISILILLIVILQLKEVFLNVKEIIKKKENAQIS